MPMTHEQIAQAGSILSAAPTVRAAAASLREAFPGLRAIVVDADDMRAETPALTLDQRALYLVSTDGHCWSVTQEPDAASGVILSGV